MGQPARGAWKEFGENLLLGYEYRACLKLGAADPANKPPVTATTRVAEAFRRVCVDIRTREVLGLYGYHRVDPPHRLWIWKDDLAEARERLNLRER